MASHSVPILLWQDHQGRFAGVPIETDLADIHLAAIDDSMRGVLGQIKNALGWWYKEQPHARAPDFLDPELIRLPVRIRPEFREADRRYPCDDVITLRVPCVQGRQENGLRVCSVPMLSILVYVYGNDDLNRLVSERVRTAASGLTPSEVASMLAPKSVSLETVRVRVQQRKQRTVVLRLSFSVCNNTAIVRNISCLCSVALWSSSCSLACSSSSCPFCSMRSSSAVEVSKSS